MSSITLNSIADVVVPSSPYGPRTRGKRGRESQPDDLILDLEELFVIEPELPAMPTSGSFPEPDLPFFPDPDEQVPAVPEEEEKLMPEM